MTTSKGKGGLIQRIRRWPHAAILLFVLVAAQVVLSFPQAHAHDAPVPHQCVACNAFALVATLTRSPEIANPARACTAAFASLSVTRSLTIADAVQGRAPPAA